MTLQLNASYNYLKLAEYLQNYFNLIARFSKENFYKELQDSNDTIRQKNQTFKETNSSNDQQSVCVSQTRKVRCLSMVFDYNTVELY